MKYPIILKISVFSILLALASCSSFNYKTYDENQNKDIADPEPNYELTLKDDFQDFTNFMFIGNRIKNFSTYFNTYFNAVENFDDAYEDYATRVLANYNEKQDSIFAKPQLSQESIDKFNVAIEKASKVIQYHKSSQFMDRSVLLIGKSYFFLGDYLKAERKFSEFISKLQASKYIDEALLYHAKTQLRLENEKPAIERFNTLIKNSKDKTVISESYQSLAEYYLNKKDYENSIKNFKKAIEFSGDSEFKAQMQFLVASVTSRSSTKQAAKEFDKVLDYNASYDLEYLARYNTAKNLVLSENFSKADDIIEDLEVKYKDISQYLAQVNYLRGLYYETKKENKQYINQYYSVIKDFPNTVSSSDASYKIGRNYEDKNDYFNAFMYYRFSTEQSNAGTYFKDAQSRSNTFKRYFELRTIITGNPINTDYNEEFRKKTTKDFENLKNDDPNKGLDNGKNGGEMGFELIFADSINVSGDSTFMFVDSTDIKQKQVANAKYELAELFLYDLNRADSSEIYLKQALDESLDYDFSAKVLFALAALYRKQEINAKSDEILNMIIRDYPSSPVANSSRQLLNLTVVDEYKGDGSDSLYEAAESFFIAGDYNSALENFRLLTNIYSSSVHLDKAYYGSGWIYENVLYNNDSAFLYYSKLVNDLPGSEAAAMVVQKVDEYNAFHQTNVEDTTSVELNENIPEDPQIKESGNNEQGNIETKSNDGNLDPDQLQKEFEKNNEQNSDGENNSGTEEIMKEKEETPEEKPPGK